MSDERFYRKMDEDKTSEHSALINREIETVVEEGEITKKVADALKVHDTRTPKIYFLPKIHKVNYRHLGDQFAPQMMAPQRKSQHF